jgi:hypothetical protein
MQPIPPRLISTQEAAVVLAALTRAPLGEVGAHMVASVPRLRVVGCCDCGCDSVTFERRSATQSGYRVADGVGYLQSGEEIGVLVWAVDDELADLEMYNYSEELPRLPQPESIRPYEEARRE